jgi:hypothetical protein
LCKQEKQAELVGTLESMTIEKFNLQDQLVRHQEEMELLREQLNKLTTAELQVRNSG